MYPFYLDRQGEKSGRDHPPADPLCGSTIVNMEINKNLTRKIYLTVQGLPGIRGFRAKPGSWWDRVLNSKLGFASQQQRINFLFACENGLSARFISPARILIQDKKNNAASFELSEKMFSPLGRERAVFIALCAFRQIYLPSFEDIRFPGREVLKDYLYYKEGRVSEEGKRVHASAEGIPNYGLYLKSEEAEIPAIRWARWEDPRKAKVETRLAQIKAANENFYNEGLQKIQTMRLIANYARAKVEGTLTKKQEALLRDLNASNFPLDRN